jgi:hypothetical protein
VFKFIGRLACLSCSKTHAPTSAAFELQLLYFVVRVKPPPKRKGPVRAAVAGSMNEALIIRLTLLVKVRIAWVLKLEQCVMMC